MRPERLRHELPPGGLTQGERRWTVPGGTPSAGHRHVRTRHPAARGTPCGESGRTGLRSFLTTGRLVGPGHPSIDCTQTRRDGADAPDHLSPQVAARAPCSPPSRSARIPARCKSMPGIAPTAQEGRPMHTTFRPTTRRRLGKAVAAAASVTALMAGALIAATPQALAAPAPPQGSSSSVVNPYSPAYGHAYRHGVLPTLTQNKKMQHLGRRPCRRPDVATGPETLSYGGGIDGIGVQSGHTKVYLVFYGTQWGTQSTDANGNLTFSGDPSGAAPVAQKMFKGIGTGSELWSGRPDPVVRRPERGRPARPAARRTPTSSRTRPAACCAGVWYDNSAASPRHGHRAPARRRRRSTRPAHFGNTTAAFEPLHLLRDPVAARHQPGQLPGPVLRVARLQRRHHADRRRGHLAATATSRSATSRTTSTPAPAAAWASSTPPAPSTATP